MMRLVKVIQHSQSGRVDRIVVSLNAEKALVWVGSSNLFSTLCH